MTYVEIAKKMKELQEIAKEVRRMADIWNESATKDWIIQLVDRLDAVDKKIPDWFVVVSGKNAVNSVMVDTYRMMAYPDKEDAAGKALVEYMKEHTDYKIDSYKVIEVTV